MKVSKPNIFSVVILLMCSMTSTPVFAITLKVQSAGEIKFLQSAKVEKIEAQVAKEVTLTEPLLYSAENKVPVILVPVCSPEAHEVQVTPLAVEETQAVSDALKKMNDGVSQFVDLYQGFEAALRAKNLSEAENRLKLMQARFPGLPFLWLAQASLSIARGQKAEARNQVEKYLQRRPDDAYGLKLLKSIKGAP